jgi:hypothetical protein
VILKLSVLTLHLTYSLHVEILDRCKDFETLHQIFVRCDAGSYDTVIGQKAKKGKSKLAMNSASSSSSLPLPNGQDEFSPEVKASETKRQGFLSQVLNKERYIDNGLVLSTKTAMELATTFVVDSSSFSAQMIMSKEKKTGKGAHPARSGRLLAQHIRENRHQQLALLLANRVCELERRFVGLGAAKETNREHIETYLEALQKILKNVRGFFSVEI